jgi:N-acetylneuraminic acid mutarotase
MTRLRNLLVAPVIVAIAACSGGTGQGGIIPKPAAGPSWLWVAGLTTNGAVGKYGVMGTAADANLPGSRSVPATWTDVSGNLWMFGGNGTDSAGKVGYLNDLWSFDPSTAQWTWVLGSSTVAASGVYGTLGTAATANIPGARQAALTWVDGGGNLWLFGGIGLDSAGNSGLLNDLWEYSPSTGEWTWMSGSSTVNAPAVYGTQGTAATNNVPGGRHDAVSWIDSSGNLWLFGGEGRDHNGTIGALNDLWEFTPNTTVADATWTWVGGSDTVNAAGVYGYVGVADTANAPGARYAAVAWIDSSGNVWLHGGDGYAASGAPGLLNDLWEYVPATPSTTSGGVTTIDAGTWTWISGSNTTNATGVYGTKGQSSSSSVPGARQGATAWIDGSGLLWVFGGTGYGATTPSAGSLNDLWSYSPSANEWTWTAGVATQGATGLYGTQGTGSANNAPGARTGARGWYANSELWLFGGDGVDSTGATGLLSDLWQFTPN